MKPLPDISGFQVVWCDRCASTNTEAAAWMRRHLASTGVVVLTDCQESGRGRLGRAWRTVAGEDLAMSVAWRVAPSVARTFAERHPLLNMIVALAARRALVAMLELEGAALRLKWPNDLYIHAAGTHRKLGGMLIEPQWVGGQLRSLVIGIGINVQSRHLHRAHRGASLWEATGRQVDVRALGLAMAEAVIGALVAWGQAHSDARSIAEDYHAALMLLNVQSRYVTEEGPIRCALQRVLLNGKAEFQTSEGQRFIADSAAIRWEGGNQTG